MIKSFVKIILFLFILIVGNQVYSQTIINQPLNNETFHLWDEYINKYAPSDSAYRTVLYLLDILRKNGRFAAEREVCLKYRPLFPKYSKVFDNHITNAEYLMLYGSPLPGLERAYSNYIKSKAPSEDAFIAVQRLTEKYIEARQWDSAIDIYSYFKPLFPSMEQRFSKIINILKADEEGLIVTNLGEKINSRADEWDPVPTPDGTHLFFSSSGRKDNYGQTDVYYSRMIDGNWDTSKNVGNKINGYNDETIDNVTADGNGLLFSGTFGGTFGRFDIYLIERTIEGWGSLQHFEMPINSQYTDEAASITADGNAIIFSSDRPGGVGEFVQMGYPFHGSEMGNMDIYVSLKTENGWSKPINLGNVINTPYSERSPFLHPDGKTLYFSSDGHSGLGRLDVFKSVRLSDTSWTEWSEPINLGKEINSSSDDWGYKIGLSGDSAFFAAKDREDSYGGWDLYSISLPDIAKPGEVFTIKGRVTDTKGNPLDCDIIWEDLSSGKTVGNLKSNPRDGSYIIILPFGRNYGYYASKDGYYPSSKNLNLIKYKALSQIREDIVLTSIPELKSGNVKLTLNNIFFDFDRYNIKSESYPELNRLVSFLKVNPDIKISIVGHTDVTGTEEYNLELSKKRALEVKQYLINKEISEYRLSIFGFGATQPLSTNDTEEGRALNRRVEIIFY